MAPAPGKTLVMVASILCFILIPNLAVGVLVFYNITLIPHENIGFAFAAISHLAAFASAFFAAIFGLRYKTNLQKSNLLFKFSVLFLCVCIVSYVSLSLHNYFSLFFLLEIIVPVLYVIGACQNKKAFDRQPTNKRAEQ